MSASIRKTSRKETEPERLGPPKKTKPERLRPLPAVIRRAILVTAGLAAAALGLWGLAVVREALGRLEQARARGGARDAVGFERERLDPLRRDGIRLFQATKSARAVARFKDSYFAATDGGLA